jgi:hypothetical protein
MGGKNHHRDNISGPLPFISLGPPIKLNSGGIGAALDIRSAAQRKSAGTDPPTTQAPTAPAVSLDRQYPEARLTRNFPTPAVRNLRQIPVRRFGRRPFRPDPADF